MYKYTLIYIIKCFFSRVKMIIFQKKVIITLIVCTCIWRVRTECSNKARISIIQELSEDTCSKIINSHETYKKKENVEEIKKEFSLDRFNIGLHNIFLLVLQVLAMRKKNKLSQISIKFFS